MPSSERIQATPSGRLLTSPPVVMLLALTVQLAVGGPVFAAEFVRLEVAAERDAALRQVVIASRTLGCFVTAPVARCEATGVADPAPIPGRVPEVSAVVSKPVERGLGSWLIDLPPPSIA